MATTLVYTISAYTPFTKILSANINQDKTDIQNRFNWSGGTDATTGLSGDNVQSNTVGPETKATIITQGVTVTALPGWGANGNNITITFTAGGLAGSEVVSLIGTAISVQISSGVSTVTQVVAALTSSALSSNLITASGSSSSTVATAGAVNLAGGIVGTGGLVRSTKLALDTANYVLINDSTGKMSSEQQLAIIRGGTGLNVVPSSQNPGDVLQINAGKTAFTLGAPTAVPASLRLYQFNSYL